MINQISKLFMPVQLIATSDEPSMAVQKLLSLATAEATRRAYQSDLKSFLDWGGRLPSSPAEVGEYLAHQATCKSPFTMARRIVSIRRAHVSLDLDDPTDNDLIRTLLKGAKRNNGIRQRQVQALLKSDIIAMLATLSKLKGVRDRAIILVGFAGALRRSELVALNVEDVEISEKGMLITIRKSKTDQERLGRKIAIPYGRSSTCAVKAVMEWIAVGGFSQGPIFRGINKAEVVCDRRLSAQAVALLLKEYASRIGLDPHEISGHSLRSGFVTSAVQAGASAYKIQQHTGHKSIDMLSRYFRDADIFNSNAAGAIL